jgi:hypothetical protein
MHGEVPSPKLRSQYIQDLQERWFIRPDPRKRHQRSKGYLGRLVGLLVAEWASRTRRIVGLEAVGCSHDLLAEVEGASEAIEVKFIGTLDSDFEKLQEMRIFGGPQDRPTASDFLLTRIYEAAKQLSGYSQKRTADCCD